MMWRARYGLRRLRWRLARALARGPLGGLLRGLFPLYLALGVAAWGSMWAWEHPDQVAAAWHRARASAGGWVEQGVASLWVAVATRLDAETAVAMMTSVLPAPGGSNGSGPEPHDSWRTPARAWVHIATGVDFSQPRSFLEAALPGFARVYRLQQDDVRTPAPGRSEPAPGDSSEVANDAEPQGAPSPAAERAEERPAASAAPSEGGARARQEVAPSPRRGADGVPAHLAALAARPWGDEPLVLILHTHTSESYETVPRHPQATATNHIFNSSETGITRVGAALAEKLQREYNIPTVHTKRIHDWPQHLAAYRNARETVTEFLARYPSIRIVLDLHRQGIKDFTFATTVSGVEAVAIDIIYTTAQNMRYGDHPNWRQNQAFAQRLGEVMEEIHPGLLRRIIRVDDSRYNQDLHPRMLLLEVGNYLDTEERAIASAQLLADAVAYVLWEVMRDDPPATAFGRATVVPPAPPRPRPVGPRSG